MSTLLDRSSLTDGSAFDLLTDESPAAIINGQTNDVFPAKDGSAHSAVDHLSREAMQRGYDMVLVYDAIEHRLRFADEMNESENPQMRNGLHKLNLRVVDASGANLMDVMLNNDITTLEPIRAQQVILRMVESAMAHSSKPKICLIIDDAHAYLSTDPQSRAMRPEEVEKFIARLPKHPGNHMILLDKRNTVHLDNDVHVIGIRGTTHDEVATLLKNTIDLQKNSDVLALAAGVPLRMLRKLIKSDETMNADTLLQKLREAKEQSIGALAGGLITCEVSLEDADAVSMHPEERKFWQQEAKLLQKNSPNAAQGALLIGPPGTGKSLRARYLASLIQLPYLELIDTGSQGLRGVKLGKYQQIFQAAIQAKPCVLFIDELDKEFPNTESSSMHSNDDAEVAAYVQRMVGSPEMRGVYIVGASNNPENMNTALQRSGRFGNRMAVLAPETQDEKNDLLKNILKSFKVGADFTPQYLSSITKHIPNDVSGSDYKELIRRALNRAENEEITLNRAILTELQTFRWTTISEATTEMKQKALEMDTVSEWRKNSAMKKN